MTLILYFLKMGLRKEIERAKTLFEILEEMVEHQNQMISNQQKMIECIEERMSIQDKRIDNVIKGLETITKKEDKDGQQTSGCF